MILEIGVKYGLDEKRNELICILVLSGITDFLDGKIARKFNMISELGKILDPVADKVTQGVLLICFLYKYKTVRYVFILFLLKEIYMSVMEVKTITATKNAKNINFVNIINAQVVLHLAKR